MGRCHGKTKSGTRCKRSVREGSRFCASHASQTQGLGDTDAPGDTRQAGTGWGDSEGNPGLPIISIARQLAFQPLSLEFVGRAGSLVCTLQRHSLKVRSLSPDNSMSSSSRLH